MGEIIYTTRPYPLSLQLNALCKCSTCGMVGRCTPTLDFYVTDFTGVDSETKGDARDKRLAGRPLTCENCFTNQMSAKGIEIVNGGYEA